MLIAVSKVAILNVCVVVGRQKFVAVVVSCRCALWPLAMLVLIVSANGKELKKSSKNVEHSMYLG